MLELVDADGGDLPSDARLVDASCAGGDLPNIVRLVDTDASCGCAGRMKRNIGLIEGAPLPSIDGSQFVFGVVLKSATVEEFACPVGVPDVYALFLENSVVGVSADEPEQFFEARFPRDAFRGHQRKGAVAEGEAHTGAEHGLRSSVSTVFPSAVFEDVF